MRTGSEQWCGYPDGVDARERTIGEVTVGIIGFVAWANTYKVYSHRIMGEQLSTTRIAYSR